jgi:hypothetical protein
VKFIGIFNKLRILLPFTVLKTIYNAFVHPNILYGIEITHMLLIWTSQTIEASTILQNKPLLTPSRELYLA